MKTYEEIESFFREAEENWALHGVNVRNLIAELFCETIDDGSPLSGIDHSDIIKECQGIHDSISKDPETFEKSINILRNRLPETTKIIIWLHNHQKQD